MANLDCNSELAQAEGNRYAGYDRIMGSISWLLIALVSLDIKLLAHDDSNGISLAVLAVMLLIYNVGARYVIMPGRSGPFKTFIDLMVFLCFVVAACWFTGRITSPFISLIYLVLMATSLTQGRRVTYFMAILAISSYVLLGLEEFSAFGDRARFIGYLLELFPFMLIAHLGAMLSGEAESARVEIERLSLTDEVTGLNNMRNFFYLADIQEKIACRYNRNFTICMIDADGLKKVNDTHGHFAGTALIRHVAEVITRNVRATDLVARYGGDEYVIMYVETPKGEAAKAVSRIVREMAGSSFPFERTTLGTTISAGIASYPEDGDDVRTLMAKADEAMYASKQQGKNRLTICGAEPSSAEAPTAA